MFEPVKQNYRANNYVYLTAHCSCTCGQVCLYTIIGLITFLFFGVVGTKLAVLFTTICYTEGILSKSTSDPQFTYDIIIHYFKLLITCHWLSTVLSFI